TDERSEVDRTALFLTLNEKLQVYGQRPLCLQVGLGCLDVHEELPLVVARAAAVKLAVATARLEWRRHPFVERIGRLYVVMPVNEHGRERLIDDVFAIYDRMAARIHRLDTPDANATHVFDEPVRRTPYVVAVGRIGADRRDAKKIL